MSFVGCGASPSEEGDADDDDDDDEYLVTAGRNCVCCCCSCGCCRYCFCNRGPALVDAVQQRIQGWRRHRPPMRRTRRILTNYFIDSRSLFVCSLVQYDVMRCDTLPVVVVSLESESKRERERRFTHTHTHTSQGVATSECLEYRGFRKRTSAW